MKRAIAVENSENRKTGLVSVTYTSQGSCPGMCPFLGHGCYAEVGPVGFITRELNKSGGSPRQIALAEAAAIDQLSGERLLRLRIVGDCRTNEAARIEGKAVTRYVRRGRQAPQTGKVAWGYTHASETVLRASWGREMSILASVESIGAARAAMKRGYAAAIVVDRFIKDSLYVVDGVKVLPCPYQTRGIQCRDCRLCLDDDRLLKAGIVIAFAAHGVGKGSVARKTLLSLL